MSFPGDPRTSSAEWRRLRGLVLVRDNWVCQLCGKPGADEVDHKVSVAQGGTDELANLQAVHDYPCHRRKTAQEANAARWQTRAARDPEAHPGMTGQLVGQPQHLSWLTVALIRALLLGLLVWYTIGMLEHLIEVWTGP